MRVKKKFYKNYFDLLQQQQQQQLRKHRQYQHPSQQDYHHYVPKLPTESTAVPAATSAQ